MRTQLFILLLPLICSLTFGRDQLIKPSIVGGSPASAGAYPWMIALVHTDRESVAEGQFCGGMLIHPYWILTAAHCVENQDTSLFEVAVGSGDFSSGSNFFEPRAIFIHPEADPLRISRGSDIALIRLSEPILYAKPVPLERAASALAIGRKTKSLGWGKTSYLAGNDDTSSVLREVETIISKIEASIDSPIHRYFVQTDGIDPLRGTYSGDSGGPLLVEDPDTEEWRLAGVTSFGYRSPDDGYNKNLFATVAHAADWIDNHLEHPSSQRPEVSVHDRITTVLDPSSKPKVAFKYWPFADGPLTTMKALRDSQWPIVTYFQLDDPRHRYNPDGSFLLMPEPFQKAGVESSAYLVELSVHSTQSYGNAPIPISPFTHQKGRHNQSAPLTMEKLGQYFVVDGLQTGWSYTYPRTGTLYAAHAKGIARVEPIYVPRPGIDRRKFVAEADVTYFVGVGEQIWDIDPYQFGILPFDALELALGQTLRGQLSEDSHLYKNQHTRVELIEPSFYGHGELRLELYSDFDAELQLFDKDDARKIGYYDIASEKETETFIFSAEDFQSGSLAVYNFDKDSFGEFTATVYQHQNQVVAFDESIQFAVTNNDQSYYSDTQNRRIYYESFKFRGRAGKDYTKVKSYVRYAGLGIAVYDGEERLGFHFGEINGEIEFESSPSKEYEIVVFDFEDYRNVNFTITLTDSKESAQAEPEADLPIALSNSSKEQPIYTLPDSLAQPAQQLLSEYEALRTVVATH